jgi:hypothetical protein
MRANSVVEPIIEARRGDQHVKREQSRDPSHGIDVCIVAVSDMIGD